MRRFVTHEQLAMIEAQKKLMQTRDAMDAARHEVSYLLANFRKISFLLICILVY